MGILDTLSALAPILSGMAASRAKNQDTNTILGTSQAAQRPNIVRQNLSNARRANDFGKGFVAPKLNWGGPGSVNRGEKAFYSGGPAPASEDTADLETLVQKDALEQAKKNYGLSDPAAESGFDKALGYGSEATGILGALGKIKNLFGGGGPSSPSMSGPASPGTFGRDPSPAPGTVSPSSTGTPFGLGGVGEGPNDIHAFGPDEIAKLLRLIGGGGNMGSATEPGGGEESAHHVGYF